MVSLPNLTVKLYNVGEVGDHSSGEFTVNWNAVLVVPFALAFRSVECGSYIVISTGVLALAELCTVTFTRQY